MTAPQRVKKILIADDYPDNLLVTEMVLDDPQCSLHFAANGQEALDKAIEESPDLILLDAVMPEITGPEVAQRLRHNESTLHTPLILLTSCDKSDLDKGCDLSIFECFVRKPFQVDDLRAKVDGLLHPDTIST